MRPSAAAPAHLLEIVELLERAFSERGGDDAAGAAVPPGLWNRALFDPLREFLGRPGGGIRARLLALGFRLAGGDGGAPPRELSHLVELLHAGSLVVDDIEDDSAQRRGAPSLHRRHGVPVALNAGNWLYFWAQAMLAAAPLPDAVRLAAHERVAACLVRAHEGQALDLTVRIDELPQAEVPAIVHAITRLKTGSLLGLATSLGALAAGASGTPLAAIDAFGREWGVALQMLDDASGIVNPERRAKAVEDLRHGRATWVWAWLARSLVPEAYQQLRAGVRDVIAGAPAEPLVERLRFRLSAVGVEPARRRLERARQAVRAVLGDGAWCGEVHTEVVRLERHYLGPQHDPA